MMDYLPLFDALEQSPARRWAQALPAQLALTQSHGHLSEWMTALDLLPDLRTSHADLSQRYVSLGTEDEITAEQQKTLQQALMALKPWRKGPYRLFGTQIDSEWRSDLKWDRIKDRIQPLNNRWVLDVGCGSGYHCWRMLGSGAERVIGIDPGQLFVAQFQAIKKYHPSAAVDVLPVPLEALPENLQAFDSVFSMGVLYHRRSPIDHLLQLRDCLRSDGELILETLVTEGPEGYSLVPENRYAKMRNVWFIPSIETLKSWLLRCKFKRIECIDITTTTTTEQCQTPWSSGESLRDFLSAKDSRHTIEGYPAPVRAILIATR